MEIKNLNSIRFIKKAIEFEAKRLVELIEAGDKVLQQTRGFDETNGSTYAIRSKEDADDYRYFADPDLPPFLITEEMIGNIRKRMPPSQKERVQTLVNQYNLRFEALNEQPLTQQDIIGLYVSLSADFKICSLELLNMWGDKKAYSLAQGQ